MKIETALQNVRRIYIDTAPLIYLVEENPHHIAKMRHIVRVLTLLSIQTYTSVVALTEILVGPLRLGNTDLAQQYHDILVSHKDYSLVAVTPEIAISAAAIRARYSMRTPDALHVASALRMDCDAFLTNDLDFRLVQDLNVLVINYLEL